MEFTIKLNENDIKLLAELLGELPTKTGAFPLLANIVNQANNQPKGPESAAQSPSDGNV